MNKLNETSLSRLISKMEQHDTGTITAYRSEYTKKENQQRNRSLFLKLSALRYRITSVEGTYIENYGTSNAIEVGEHVFFVEDWQDRGKLENDLRQLGEEFEQDSVLFIPNPGKQSYLWGTNPKGQYVKYNEYKIFPNIKFSNRNEFLTRVNGRPFFFESIIKEYKLPEGFFSRWGCQAGAKESWQKLLITENDEKPIFKKHKLTKKEAESLSLKEDQIIYIQINNNEK